MLWPPPILTAGGVVNAAVDGACGSGAVWRVHVATGSDMVASGTAGPLGPNIWAGDVGGDSFALAVGTDCVAVVSHEIGVGTMGHTGYFAVVNHILTGDDPAEFPDMTLRPIPIPAVTSAVTANLSWPVAVTDPGEGGATNLIGYTVYRSVDGTSFVPASTSILIGTSFIDGIPNDGEYYYALGLVFRGNPPVTSAVISANSARTFKDSDGDGLPDYYEIAAGLDENSGVGDEGPLGDPDGDTMSNLEEWIAGTLSRDGDSRFFAKETAATGDGVTVRWDGVAGRSYTLFRTTDLGSDDWALIHGPVACVSNSTMSHADTTPAAGPRFYRLKVKKD